MAFVSDRAGNSDLGPGAQRATGTQITTSTANESEPDWSPDGQSLVFRSESNGGGLFVVRARGGPVRKIASFGYKPRWSPDSKLVLFSSSGHRGGTPRFHLVDANGGEPRALPADVFGASPPCTSRGGRTAAQFRSGVRDARDRWTLLTSSINGGIAGDGDEVIPLAGGRTTLLEFGRLLRPIRLGPIRHAPLFRGLLSGNAKPVESHRRSKNARLDWRTRATDIRNDRRRGLGGLSRRHAGRVCRQFEPHAPVGVSVRPDCRHHHRRRTADDVRRRWGTGRRYAR